MSYHDELPDELQGSGQARPESDQDRLAAIGQVIAKKRDEAVRARKESGIEDIWMRCEEAYLGMDEANRGDFSKAKWAKPTSMTGPVTTNETQRTGNRSTAFVRLTTRYVDMGASKISEIALPINDKAFSLSPTPVPDLIEQEKDFSVVTGPDGQPVWRDAVPADLERLGANPAAQFLDPAGMQVPLTKADYAGAVMRKARKAAEKAEKRIFDWMLESRYPMQMRKVIFDGARIGVGVLKGPFPDVRTRKSFAAAGGVGKLKIVQKIAPACRWIDPWNFYPAANCGEDIQEGDYCFERDFLSATSLKKLKQVRDHEGKPVYLAAQIDKVIAEGPEKCNTDAYDARNPVGADQKNRFSIWHMTGVLSREDMQVLGAPAVDELPEEVCECFCIVSMVNDTVIRATLNPLMESGHLPYRVYPWSRRAGHWAGVGVAEQVDLPQKMVNGGTRAWLNNAGISSGVQIFIDQFKIAPLDGSMDITPNKVWGVTAEGMSDDVRKFMQVFEIPNRGKELMEIINYAMRLAEELSNIPLVSQGQAGPNDPQTFGQAELQNNNANTLLRQLAYSLDDHITEPLVDDFYEWLLLSPEVPDDEKGDFDIDARGSVTMVEKAIQEATLVNMLALALNPAYKQDPEKVFRELLKAKRIDPDKTALTDEQIAQMTSQPPPKAPAVEAAQIQAASREKVAALQAQTAERRMQTDIDRDAVYEQSRRDIVAITARSAEAKRLQDYQLALAKYANDRQITLDQAKVELTKAAMELQTQVRLATGGTGKAPQVATPAIEPVGRAPDGEAFQR